MTYEEAIEYIPNDMDEYCGICGQAIDWEAGNGEEKQ